MLENDMTGFELIFKCKLPGKPVATGQSISWTIKVIATVISYQCSLNNPSIVLAMLICPFGHEKRILPRVCILKVYYFGIFICIVCPFVLRVCPVIRHTVWGHTASKLLWLSLNKFNIAHQHVVRLPFSFSQSLYQTLTAHIQSATSNFVNCFFGCM